MPLDPNFISPNTDKEEMARLLKGFGTLNPTLLQQLLSPVVAGVGFSDRIIARSKAPSTWSTSTQNLPNQVLDSFILPANSLGSNGYLNVVLLTTNTASGGTKNMTMTVGGVQVALQGASTNPVSRYNFRMDNVNSPQSQISMATSGFGGTGTPIFRNTIDTTQPQLVQLATYIGNQGDSVTLEKWVAMVSYLN